MEHVQQLSTFWLHKPALRADRRPEAPPPLLLDRDDLRLLAERHHKQLVQAKQRTGSNYATLRAQTEELRRMTLGLTSEAPSDDRAAEQTERYGPGFAPVLVAWSDPAESPLLAGAVAGFAGPVAAVDGGGARLVSGQVVLDAPAFRGFRARDEGRGVLLHELAHLMGLDHVDDPRDIMNAESEQGSPITDYTPGALRGLRLLGAGQCFG